MKNFVLILFVFFTSTFKVVAQKYGNEWIDYSQKYFSFPILKTGIHKIDYDVLNDVGIPLSTINTDGFQVFGRDKEIPIFIEDGGDSSIDPGDYILFFAEKNDGWLDSNLYEDSTWIGNPKYSLFNDTINYFISWNNSNNNLRFEESFDNDFNNYSPSNFIIQKVEQSYNNFYNPGANRTSYLSSSFYMPGEGFGRSEVNGTNGSSLSINLLTRSPYLGVDAPEPIFHGKSTGNYNSDYTGVGNHHTRWTVGSSNFVLHDEVFTGFKLLNITQTFSASLLNNGNTAFKWAIIPDQGATRDVQSLNYLSIEYAKLPTLNGSSFGDFKILNNQSQAKVRLDLTSTGLNNPILFVFGDVPRKPQFINNNGVHSALFENSSLNDDQRVVIQNFSNITDIGSISAVNTNGYFTDFRSLSYEGAVLMVYDSSLYSSVLDYESYRKSSGGGGYNTILADVNELYLQFGGGVKKHISGIRRFAYYAYAESTSKPQGVFLIGKAISFNSARRNTTNYALNQVPSFGFPASDAAITSDFKNNNKTPLVPVGRISVNDVTDLDNYLSKVIEFEAAQDPNSIYTSSSKLWQKQILHFGGGDQENDQVLYQNFLNQMQTEIEDSLFGGNVYRVYKNVSTPFDPSHLTNISNKIRDGVSIMTFFGHGYVGGFDINIDEPSAWNNKGKYPLVIANSCYNGNMFSNISNVAIETYVNVKDGGAIAYIGSTDEGYDLPLGQFTTGLYKQISKKSYGLPISHQIKNTIQDVILNGNTSVIYETALFQMNLNGDPLLKINPHLNPEIEITEDKVWVTPSKIDLTVDSIEVNIAITNLGHSVTDTFSLEIRRNFPLSNIDSVYFVEMSGLNYIDTLKYKIPMQPNIGVGINTITVSIDIPSLIPEVYDEISNNKVIKTLFIDIQGILPVLPQDFAVVPLDSVVLKASTINPIADFNTYRFEIDTNDAFNSDEHRYALVNGLGGVKEVYPSDWISVSSNQISPLKLEDSVVYFWRVAIDSSVLEWRQRSFQFIEDREGWGQDHFSQFKGNDIINIELDTNNRLKVFNETIADTLSANIYNTTTFSHAYFINGQQIDYTFCSWPAPSLNVVVIDAITHEPWKTRYVPTGENLDKNFGNLNDNGACRSRPDGYFEFLQNSTSSLQALDNMLTNEIPDSSYVLIYSNLGGANFASINSYYPNIFNTFTSIGSSELTPTKANSTFAIIYKKGDPNSVLEKFSSSSLSISYPLKNKEFIGVETSPLIGPSANWDRLLWKQNPLEVNSPDSTRLKVNYYNNFRSLQGTIDTVFSLNDSILDLNNLIDANSFPYIKLTANYYDSLMFTPAQLDYWHVLYQPLPEAAIDGTSQFSWVPLKDTLDEGENVSFAVDVKNIYKYPMDSLLITYWIEDNYRVKHYLPYDRRDSLRVGEVIRDTIQFSTIGFGGVNSLWMEVNPYVNGNLVETDQPEQEHFNNLLQVPFFVRADNENPLLDVTFDGIHILNGDIVAPNTEIVVSLKDENELMLMDSDKDTSSFGIYIINSEGIQNRIPFINSQGETVMQWVPASGDTKKFKIIYPTYFEKDGLYTLLVQGADRSGNLSGDLEYRISFEVIRESSITKLMNYPNPFTTSTRFVFTLTGVDVPDEMIIQILTVSGKVVREITEDEIGSIRIGRNITEYTWDGTDEFGDPLANGVYLYRAKIQLNGEEIKQRDSGADKYFNQEFGKMYLMR